MKEDVEKVKEEEMRRRRRWCFRRRRRSCEDDPYAEVTWHVCPERRVRVCVRDA